MKVGDVVATSSDPRERGTPGGEQPPEPLLAKLSTEAAFWVDGGSISRWRPVYGRSGKAVAPPGQTARFVFTRVPATPPLEGSIRRWVEHQRRLVVAPESSSPSLVFWRLALRQRAFAIDTHASSDVKTASERVRHLARRAGDLQVALGFFAGESIPAWVVSDDDVAVMVGLPQYHLVQTSDPATSLAALVSSARIKPQVHEVSAAP